MGELALQFLLVEPFPLEDLHLLVYGGDGVAPLLQLRDAGQDGGVGVPLQRRAGIRVVGPFFAQAKYRDLLESLKLPVGKAPHGEAVEVFTQDAADVRGQPVIGDHIDEQPAQHQMAHALYQKPLLVPRPAAALVEDGEIGRVEEQQVEGLGTDAAVEETAHAHAVQPCLGLLRAALVQFHAVGKAVVALGDLPQGLAAAAAGVEDIGSDALREPDAPQDMSDVLRIGGIVSHAHLVHQSADGLGVHGVRALGKFFGKAAQGLIDRLVGPGHEVESGKSGLQFAGDSGPGVFLQLQKRQSGVAQGGGQPRAHLLQFLIAAPGPLGIGLEVFLHSGPPGQKFRAAPQNGAPGRRRLGRGEGHFLPLLVFLFAHADSPQLSASISGCSISLKRPVSFIAWTGSRYSALVSDSLGPTVN